MNEVTLTEHELSEIHRSFLAQEAWNANKHFKITISQLENNPISFKIEERK